MEMKYFISWFGIMLPLSISPGPGNIVLAASGSKQGFKRSFPLIFGINFIIIIYSLLIGFGLGEFLKRYPNLLFGIKIMGIIYILYLAYKFLKTEGLDPDKENSKVYGFYDGVILQLLNPKGIVMLFLMFSLFLNENKENTTQVIYLILMFMVLNITCNTIWVSGGSVITKLISNKKSQRILNYIFSFSLVMVVMWLSIEAIENY